ncbi:MAG TPA: ABC transporter permease subunit [Thermoplasmata archaeon]|nr:ABC transporter permease subunit [Thermoplasmata archaeon]
MAAPVPATRSTVTFHPARGYFRRGISRKNLRILGIAIIALALVAALLFPAQAATAVQLPWYALLSTLRMFLAFFLSLAFAISYGSAAASSRRAGEILIPILDILQSVPILGFFPVVLLVFVDAFPSGSPFGKEFAIIFLIFTSMSWNMAFAVYETLTTLPHDLEDSAAVFGVKGWLRFRRLAFPATIPKLVYNSILSWTVGWFYLVASEAFQAAAGNVTTTYSEPGIGSYLYFAGQAGNLTAILLGLATLTIVVLILDVFMWRPLSAWAERFKVELTAGGEVSRAPAPYERLRWIPRLPRLRAAAATRLKTLVQSVERVGSPLERFYTEHPRVFRTIRRVDAAMFLVIFLLVVAVGAVNVVALFHAGPPAVANAIPNAVIHSLGRLALAYLVALAWTIPTAAWLVHNARASKFLTPVIEVVASVPATALFPLIIAFAILAAGAFGLAAELAAFLVSLFAMQWYILFNVIAGMKSIPGDLMEASKVFGLHGWAYWRRVLLPAVIPSLLTGSITAWGAGWNALIVAEYISYGNQTFTVTGVGELISAATYAPPSPGASEQLALAILALIVVVLVMNKLLWRPLIKRASHRFRMEIQ